MGRISVVLVFVVGIGRPIAARTVTWPFADLGDTLESGRTVHRSGGGSSRTKPELVRLSPVSIAVTVDSRQRETASTSEGSPAAQAPAAAGPMTSLGALSSRVSLFLEGGYGAALQKNDDDVRVTRIVGQIGVRLKF